MPSAFDAFVDALGEGNEPPLTAAQLDRLVEETAERIPGVTADPVSFASALGSLAAAGVSPTDADIEEVWLAVACAAGQSTATEELERRYLGQLAVQLKHLQLDDATLADVLQTTRRRLLIGKDGATPRIVGYAGRGQLAALTRVVATRAALDAKRSSKRKREVDLGGLTQVLMASATPEMLAAAAHKEQLFREAFEAAIAALPAADRTIMRLYAVDGVGIDGVAAAIGVHRSTAARRLAKVRESIHQATRDELQRRGANKTELESILAVVDDGLELTLSRILAEPFDA